MWERSGTGRRKRSLTSYLLSIYIRHFQGWGVILPPRERKLILGCEKNILLFLYKVQIYIKYIKK